MIYRLIHADVMDGLRSLASESAQSIVTSPPYWGLRDYGIEQSVWGGDPTHTHRFGAAETLSIDNSDKRRWNHSVNGRGETAPDEKKLVRKSGEVTRGAFCECGAWIGCLGLEPTPELFVEHIVTVFREARRVLKNDGTLWLNLGDSYAGSGKGGDYGNSPKQATSAGSIGVSAKVNAVTNHAARLAGHGDFKAKDLIGIPWMVAFALRADGWYLRSDIVWHKPNPMPESVTDRPTKSHEYLFLLAKSSKYLYDADAIAEPIAECTAKDRVDTGRFRPERGFPGAASSGSGRLGASETRNRRSVWTVPTSPFPEAHFATFPPDLIEPCILAGSRVGDTVLDPFNGAGTTGVVALSHQRDYAGIDRSAEYIEISRRRLEKVAPMFAQEIAE